MSRKKRITSVDVAEPGAGMWSNSVLVGDTLYFSGLTSRGLDGVSIDGDDEYTQTKVILDKMKSLVEAAQGNMDDIVQLSIFVTNVAGNKGVWEARREFFRGDFPACALVEVSALGQPEILVEIQGVARIGCSS